jgi:antirestriction protein ArdC
MSPRNSHGRSGPRFDAQQAVTDRIIAALEAGTVPWRQPWRGGGAQANVISKRPYRGINQLLLPLAGFASPWWLTFKQLDAVGGRIREGEARSKGGPGPSLVTFWKVERREDEETGEVKRRFLLRTYNVWNVDQVEGLPEGLVPEPEPAGAVEPIEACEAILAGYVERGGPTLAYGGGSAHYNVVRDHLQLPDRERFHSREALYSTAFHEAVHSTGAEKRLDREELCSPKATFGSPLYAKEELVAEIGAAMLCTHAQIDTEPLGANSAAYIAHWLGHLRDDKGLVISAASKAQRAVDLVAGEQDDDPEAPAAGAPVEEAPPEEALAEARVPEAVA